MKEDEAETIKFFSKLLKQLSLLVFFTIVIFLFLQEEELPISLCILLGIMYYVFGILIQRFTEHFTILLGIVALFLGLISAEGNIDLNPHYLKIAEKYGYFT